jgi:G:T/U-mismatch repair DNA glycosylase
MGRSDVAECGKRFSSEYQPEGRGRPKGSLNRRTMLRRYMEAQEPRTLAAEIQIILDDIFGKQKARRLRRRLRQKGVKMWQGGEPEKN